MQLRLVDALRCAQQRILIPAPAAQQRRRPTRPGTAPAAAVPSLHSTMPHSRDYEGLGMGYACLRISSPPACPLDRPHRRLESESALLRRILPDHVIRRMGPSAGLIADSHISVTVLFADLVGFTVRAPPPCPCLPCRIVQGRSTWRPRRRAHALAAPQELCERAITSDVIRFLNTLFTRFDELMDQHGVCKVDTIGDAYMCVCGHEAGTENDHATRMMAAAKDMLKVRRMQP